MRALHLIPGNLYGGVEAFLALIARRKDLLPDVENHFAISFEGRLAEELAAARATLHRLGPVRTRYPWTIVRGRRRLARLLEEQRFDVALTHSSWPHAMFSPVLARFAIPDVFYLHGPITEVGWLDRWAARHPPATLVAVSQHTLGTGRLLFPAVHAEVLNYPMPWDSPPEHSEARAAVRAELGAKPGEVVLLQASRADAWKGHDQLVAALGELRDEPGWCLWLASGAQRPHEARFLARLREQVETLGLGERIRFLGERRDVPRLMAGADLYVQANRGPEGFSVVFIEAFAAGLPIVTMRLGGAAEMVDETCGALVEPGDVIGFAQALRELVRAPERRRAMSERARARVAERCNTAARLADLARILRETAAFGAGAPLRRSA